MNKEKLKLYANAVIVILGAALLVRFFLAKLILLALPFLISWGVAFCVRPISHKIAGRVKIPHKWISLLLTLIVIFGGISLIAGVLVYAAREAWSFLSGLADEDKILELIKRILNPIGGIFGDREGAAEIEAQIAEAVRGIVSSFLSGFVSTVTKVVSSVPGILIFLLVTVISAVYFSLDLDNINQKIKDTLPPKISVALVNFKNKFLIMALRYMRAYLTIMAIVFSMLLVGFFIIKSKYALLLAVIFALLDMLPLVGIGTFMVPWGIFEIAFGNSPRGIAILVIFGVTELVRNLIEPKILGKNLGIHPILSLVLLYVSYSVFGILGLFLIPLLTVVLNIFIDKNNPAEVTEGYGSK